MSNTSTDVKRRYNEKAYVRIHLQVPKDIGEKFKAKCERENVPQRQVLIEAIEQFLKG
jgi:hypothetical protein